MTQAPLPNTEIRASALGRTWRLARAADLEELWNAMAENDFADERVPYWTELWPSAPVLADWLATKRDVIRGELCLDLGCGLGLTSLVGQSLGARVVAADYEPEALTFCALNARLNGVHAPALLATDWRAPAIRAGIFPFVWGADIIYERRFFIPVIDALSMALTREGICWLAEPGRTIFSEFLETASRKGWEATKVAERVTPGEGAKGAPITVTVWRMRKPAPENRNNP